MHTSLTALLINAIRAMIFFDCYLPRVLQETPIGRTMRSAWNMDRLSGPFSCGMGCDVEVNCTTPVMRQHHQHEQDLEINVLHNQEIRNPFRCHAITISGLTRTKAERQPFHSRASKPRAIDRLLPSSVISSPVAKIRLGGEESGSRLANLLESEDPRTM